jgi:signal transduction histidine kinase
LIFKTRLKITGVTMLMLLLVFTVTGAVVFSVEKAAQQNGASAVLSRMLEGARGPQFPLRGDSRGFTVAVQNNIVRIINYDSILYSEEDILSYTAEFLEAGKAFGSKGNIYYRIEAAGGVYLLAVTDRSAEIASSGGYLQTYLIASAGSFLLLTLGIWLLSYFIVKPVKETLEKQKQFVYDASHELKTPVTIISANMDVLAAGMEDNKWARNIRSQTQRMASLIGDLLTLAESSRGEKTEAARFNLSDAAKAAILPFESVVYENGNSIETDIEPGLFYSGDEKAFDKALNILLENALQYSDAGGRIAAALRGGGRPQLTVYNTGRGIPDGEKSRIFERFYRSDSSRARETGGSGLGLSILAAIAEKQGWKLSVRSEEGVYAEFSIWL